MSGMRTRAVHGGREDFAALGVHAAPIDLPETISVTHVAGPDDFIVHVAVADATHLQRLLLDRYTTRKEVTQLHTNLVFEHHRRRTLAPTADVLS